MKLSESLVESYLSKSSGTGYNISYSVCAYRWRLVDLVPAGPVGSSRGPSLARVVLARYPWSTVTWCALTGTRSCTIHSARVPFSLISAHLVRAQDLTDKIGRLQQGCVVILRRVSDHVAHFGVSTTYKQRPKDDGLLKQYASVALVNELNRSRPYIA